MTLIHRHRRSALLAEKEARAAEHQHTVSVQAGLDAVITELVSRAVNNRRNYGYYPPTPDELIGIAEQTRAFWAGFAAAAAQAVTP